MTVTVCAASQSPGDTGRNDNVPPPVLVEGRLSGESVLPESTEVGLRKRAKMLEGEVDRLLEALWFGSEDEEVTEGGAKDNGYECGRSFRESGEDVQS